MKIYACAISADNRKNSRFEVFPAAISATNEEEAIGKAIKIAYEQNPQSDGYSSHQVSIVEIPHKWIQEIKNNE